MHTFRLCDTQIDEVVSQEQFTKSPVEKQWKNQIVQKLVSYNKATKLQATRVQFALG